MNHQLCVETSFSISYSYFNFQFPCFGYDPALLGNKYVTSKHFVIRPIISYNKSVTCSFDEVNFS